MLWCGYERIPAVHRNQRVSSVGEQGKQPISQLDPSMWVDRHGDGLYGYALARLRDPEAAEEVVQETFVSALVSESMERKLSFREWLELRMHLALCGLCNGFAKQVRLLHEAARRHGRQFADNQAAGEIKLSPEARARIQAVLRDHMA